jgi:hypothetical protein
VLFAVGCSKRAPATDYAELVVFGDSIAEESMPFVQTMTWPKGFVARFFGGTAPCDWTGNMPALSESSMVVITFTGNSQTPCMSDGAGGQLRGPALVEQYRVAVKSLVDRARDAGAWVILVGQPARAGNPLGNTEVDGINAMYRSLASEKFVAFVDAGAAVENADGSPATSLPCAPLELACDPSGSNPVRNDDGVHLCPGHHQNPCPVYSSGAWRFANAIVGGVSNPAAYD